MGVLCQNLPKKSLLTSAVKSGSGQASIENYVGISVALTAHLVSDLLYTDGHSLVAPPPAIRRPVVMVGKEQSVKLGSNHNPTDRSLLFLPFRFFLFFSSFH